MEQLPQTQVLSVDPQAHPGPRMRNPDVWFCIFEYVAEERQKKSILSIMMVNKTWKAIATPLLYRFIEIRQEKTGRLLDHLARTQRHEFIDVPTRELALRERRSASKTHEKVSSLLLFFPALRSFTCESPVSYAELGSLLRTCGHCLLSLDVVTPVDTEQAPLSLGIIGRMKALTTLKLGLSGFESLTDQCDESLPGIELPNLKSLEHRKTNEHWAGTQFRRTRHLDYLGRCNFPVLVDLTLASPMSEEEFLCAEQGLGRFFAKHGRMIVRLSLQISRDNQPMPVWIVSTLKKLNTLTFLEERPCVGTLESIPLSVRNLRIPATRVDEDEDDEAELAYLMDTLVTTATTTNIKNVVLLDLFFRWSQPCDLDPELRFHMLEWGLALAEHGITLFDSEGRGIRMKTARAKEFEDIYG